ncbi:MAG: hypothetical protein U9R33_00580, partial [candidate division NC10 bacterium]|nr:hypothetical protein [candidate division NC10 bacterium]
MRKHRLFVTIALLVGLCTAPGPNQSWAQQQPTAVSEGFSEANITPENVAKNPRLAEWVAKHPRLAH